MSEIQEMVDAAKAPGKFNIVDAVRNRAYPVDQVEVFIDEGVAYRAAELDGAISKISESLDKKKDLVKKEIDEITKRRDEIFDEKEKLVQEMGGTRYVFHVTGISEGARQDLFDKAVEKYPIKQEKNRNPFTGELEKTEVEDINRDRFFTSLLWQAHISKIVAPDGSEQDGITLDEATELRRSLPLASITKITEAIEKMRAATAIFMMSVNEDFLAKS
jgi:hypothetical protein